MHGVLMQACTGIPMHPFLHIPSCFALPVPNMHSWHDMPHHATLILGRLQGQGAQQVQGVQQG